MRWMQWCCCAALAFAPAAWAGLDQLTTPALMSPRAASSVLLGVSAAGARLVAVGERGIVVGSDDRGASWTQSVLPLSSTLTGVHFPTAQHGWAVGHDGVILHSADGGLTWVKQLDGNMTNTMLLAAATEREKQANAANDANAIKQAAHALEDAKAAAKFGPSRPLLAVWFRNEREGFAAGSYGLLLHTEDAGAHWALWSGRVDNPDGYHFNSLMPTASGALLMAGEAGRVYRSTDGGATWETSNTGYKGQLYGALGVRNEAGGEDIIAFGFKGNVFRLAAGGKAWEAIASGTAKNLTAGIVLPNGEPAFLSQDGRLLLGSDHGRHLRAVGGTPFPAVAVTLVPGGIAIAGLGGVKTIFFDAASGAIKP
ncbi:WD40/YVTN/BNR-like repeat-containing protein [Piscinibacter terrae]|uniref:Photosystem I reaction center subunit IV n=1 Tax=Piscinibacter terrae TaxID=2496871 RepID=A0A3N7HPS5_9BURK|nr:YCF48-related protein [Albitalea terrae]RQP23703.1 photosystem I reaction center subunit IV [Albitalea terrae]